MTPYADLIRRIHRAVRRRTGIHLAVEHPERLEAMVDTLDAATEAAHNDS